MSEIFKTKAPKRSINLVAAIAAVARDRQVSPPRIVAEILRLNRGRQRLSWQEYFLYGAYRPGLTAAERSAFLGGSVMRAVNEVFAVRGRGVAGLLADKLLTDQLLTNCAIPVAGVRAVAVAGQLRAACPVLSDPPALAAFLASTPLPFFGKPVHVSRSVGAVSVVARDGTLLVLGNGQQAPAATFARDVFRDFPDGYLFQNLMQPHPELARIVGPVIASVRIVSIRIGSGVVPLYAAMKMPGPGQMVDDVVSVINTMCAIGLDTGRILRGQDSCKFGGTDMLANPVSGTILRGAQLPHWPEVVALAGAAHALFLRQGIVGADIAITPDGPRVIELNSYPMHGFYQKCFARGFWNADIAPVVTEALARAGHRKPTRDLRLPWKIGE